MRYTNNIISRNIHQTFQKSIIGGRMVIDERCKPKPFTVVINPAILVAVDLKTQQFDIKSFAILSLMLHVS